jgi:hypothetical protein
MSSHKCTHQCKCICHTGEFATIHIVDCCSPCQTCGLKIKSNLMKEHLKVCHADSIESEESKRNYNLEDQSTESFKD